MENQIENQRSQNRENLRALQGSSLNIPSAAAALVVGIALGVVTLTIPLLAIPLAVFIFLILPWLMRVPFRLYIWLLITWPVLTLYIRISDLGPLPDITYERVIVPILFAILLAEGLALRKKLPSISIFILGYVVAHLIIRIALFFVGGTGTPDIIYLLNTVILPITLYWITKALVTSRTRLIYLLYALVAVSIIICLSGLYERAINAVVSPFPIGQHSSIGQSRWLDVPGGRAAGIAANPAIFGGILGFGILAGFCCFTYASKKLTQYFFLWAIILLLYGVLVTFTRVVWISVAFVLFFAQFLIGKLWKLTLPIWILTVLVGIILGTGFLDPEVLQNRILNPTTIEARVEMSQVALDKFTERPILGWGPDAYNRYVFDYVQGASRSFGASTSHNTYFTMLIDGGVVLLMSFVLMVFSFFWKASQVVRQTLPGSFERSVLWAMVGFVVLFLLLGISNDLRDFIYFNVLLFISAAVIENLIVMNVNHLEPHLTERQPFE